MKSRQKAPADRGLLLRRPRVDPNTGVTWVPKTEMREQWLNTLRRQLVSHIRHQTGRGSQPGISMREVRSIAQVLLTKKSQSLGSSLSREQVEKGLTSGVKGELRTDERGRRLMRWTAGFPCQHRVAPDNPVQGGLSTFFITVYLTTIRDGCSCGR
jgi:hypothetical protein